MDENLEEPSNTDDLLQDRSGEQDQMLEEMSQEPGQTLTLSADDPAVAGKKEGDTVQISAVINKVADGTVELSIASK